MTLAEAADILAYRLRHTTADRKAKIKVDLQESLEEILSDNDDWDFMEREGTFVTVADKYSYSIPTDLGITDYSYIDCLQVVGEPFPVVPCSLSRYDNVYRSTPTNTSDKPLEYAEWAGNLLLGPVPSTATAIYFKYYASTPILTDTSTPPWPSRWNWVWLLGAEYRGLRYNDDQRSELLKTRFAEGIKKMRVRTKIQEEAIMSRPYSSSRPAPLLDPIERDTYWDLS